MMPIITIKRPIVCNFGEDLQSDYLPKVEPKEEEGDEVACDLNPLEKFSNFDDKENRFKGLPLQVEYIDGVKWRVSEDIAYTGVQEYLTKFTTTVRKGFIFDFASVPFILKLFAPAAGTCRNPYGLAALFHDWLYYHQKASGQPIDRLCADHYFYEIMRYMGCGFIISHSMFRAVRLFGWIPWRSYKKQRKEREIKETGVYKHYDT